MKLLDRLEKEKKENVDWIRLSSKDYESYVEAYFDKNNEIEHFYIFIGGWYPHIPPEAVEEAFKRYGDKTFYSVTISDFDINVYDNGFRQRNEYVGNNKLNKKLREIVKSVLNELEIKFDELDDYIAIRKYQGREPANEKRLRKVYEIGLNNYLNVRIFNGKVQVSNNSMILSPVKKGEIDSVEEFLNKYGQELYNDDFVVEKRKIKEETKKPSNLLKFY